MTDPIPTKFCVGKEMTKLPQRSVKTTWDGSHPKKNYEWEEEQPRWTTSNYFKLGPPTPTATTAPTFPRPDGFAAGKKRKQGEPPPISCPHCGAIFSFFGGHCSSSRRHYIQFVWGETRYLCKRYFSDLKEPSLVRHYWELAGRPTIPFLPRLFIIRPF